MAASKNALNNYYDVVYKTKSGRVMIAKRIAEKKATLAINKVKRQMKASSTFDKVIMAIKL